MIRSLTNESVTVWGLDASRLHEAYWRSRGVQCVRLGERKPLLRAAELFACVEPDRLVAFDLASLTEHLAWRRAVVTRLRIVEETTDSYGEQVVTDDRGNVVRIERRYRPRTRGSTWIILTRSRRVAKRWMEAGDARSGWRRIRGSLRWSRIDHLRRRGGIFAAGDAADAKRFVEWLVASWHRPDQVIEGIVEHLPGVWMWQDQEIPENARLVAPLWVGREEAILERSCMVGPQLVADGKPIMSPARLRALGRIEEVDAAATESTPPTWSRTYAVAKRSFDIVMSLAVLVVAAPLLVIAACWIWWEDGWPIFYGHKRQTTDDRVFRCWKFRTMCRDADKLTSELADRNMADGPQVNIRHDPRITRVGHVFRRLQIDEVPQFLNVLLGHMSIVGPRPSPDDENQYCPVWREQRLSVRPGITGLWQLERTRAPGRDFQEWIRFDLEYVRNASFLFDLKICVKTATTLLRGSRAECT